MYKEKDVYNTPHVLNDFLARADQYREVEAEAMLKRPEGWGEIGDLKSRFLLGAK